MYDIIENNPNFIVVYKRPNVSFHSESGEAGLFETIKQRENFSELYPVHRLDKITSGLLVMAKRAEVNHILTAQFRAKQIEKYYFAISAHKPKKKQGMIRGDMAPARRGAWKLLPTLKNPAVTQFFSRGYEKGKRVFIVKPQSGKTHQIRVALKSIGSPILGDSLYGDKSSNSERSYLHAYSLGFKVGSDFFRFYSLPREGKEFSTTDFLNAVSEYQAPWSLSWPTLAKLPVTCVT